MRREEFSVLFNGILTQVLMVWPVCHRARLSFTGCARESRTHSSCRTTRTTELSLPRDVQHALRSKGVCIGANARIAAHLAWAVRQSTRRSVKIEGSINPATLYGEAGGPSSLFARTDNRIRSSVCARLGRIAAQVG